jgi:cell wall-associated NlpC family hydrolase
MVLGSALAATVAVPGYAQPDEVPDPGARPVPVGEIPLPDGSAARPTPPRETVIGPLAAEIAQVEIEIGTMTAQLQAIAPALGSAETAAETAADRWETARAALEERQATLDRLVGESYQEAAALPPELFLPELRSLSAHAPALPVDPPLGVTTAARELIQAIAEEDAARELFEAARGTEQTLAEQYEEIEEDVADLREELADLRERNAELLAEAERRREAAEQAGADERYPVLEPVAGHRAATKARLAVEFALDQLGKPYEWGAEGPHRYDCSGLVWAAYQHVNVSLPRVAADQYWGTRDRLVTRSAVMAQRGLLPGDLVFFSSGPTWQSIHHVGMYVGDGYMVHAPNRNEVVKVSPVWWSRFFGATRVVEAVPVPGADPTPTPGPSQRPPGVIIVPPDPDPTDSPTTPPPPSTPPPDEPTTEPTEEPTGEPTASPTDEPSADPTGSPSSPPETSEPPTSPTPEDTPGTESPSPTATQTSTPSAATPSPTADIPN